MELPTGHYLQKGKYQLTETVGRGGFGITYKGVWFTEVKGSLGKVKTEVPRADALKFIHRKYALENVVRPSC